MSRTVKNILIDKLTTMRIFHHFMKITFQHNVHTLLMDYSYHYNIGVHVDVTIRSTLVVLFPPFNSTAGVELVIHSDDIAHEYIEYFSIRLVLLTPLNETGVILRENIALYIYDNDSKFDMWTIICLRLIHD